MIRKIKILMNLIDWQIAILILITCLYSTITNAGTKRHIDHSQMQLNFEHKENSLRAIDSSIHPAEANEVFQTVGMWSCDWVTIFNPITGYNTMSPADLDSGKIASIVIKDKAVHFGDKQFLIIEIDDPPMSVMVHDSGSTVVVSNSHKLTVQHSFELLFELIDGTVRRSYVQVISDNPTRNPVADYGNQTVRGLSNYEFDRRPYSTKFKKGAMLLGWDRSDHLIGGPGSDAIFGWNENDYIDGKDGIDFLFGEKGLDTLTGGKGADYFGITTCCAETRMPDTVTDFNPAEGDVLGISDWFTTNLTEANALELVDIQMDETDQYALVSVKQAADSDSNLIARLFIVDSHIRNMVLSKEQWPNFLIVK